MKVVLMAGSRGLMWARRKQESSKSRIYYYEGKAVHIVGCIIKFNYHDNLPVPMAGSDSL